MDKHFLDNMIFNLENRKNLKEVKFTKDAVKEVLEYLKELKEKDQQIHDLQEQLKNAVMPKFKVGQEVFYFEDASSAIVIDEIQLRRDKFFYMDYRYGEYFTEDELFATREDAEQRLAELKGEK